MAGRRVVCTDHATTNPCPGCAADHKVGDHARTPHADTCRACRSEARAAAAPTPAAPRPRHLDVAALAAHDDTLSHLTEV